MASASRSRWGETRDLGLSCDLYLQTRRKVFSVRFRLGPTIPHLLSQIRHGNIPYRRHLEPRVPSFFPGDTRPRIPPDFCLRPKAYEKARRSVDETPTSLSVHHAYQWERHFHIAQSRWLHIYGRFHWQRRSPKFDRICEEIFSKLKLLVPPFDHDYKTTRGS